MNNGAAAAAVGAVGAVGVAAEISNNPQPNKYLIDFWKTLWHVDVKKDHVRDYDTKIINNFLPNATYSTTQTYNGTHITKQGETANREFNHKVVDFSDLFGHLTGQTFKTLCNLGIGSKRDIELNPTLLGPGVKYAIEIFDINGNNMNGFVEGNNIAMYIDTFSHIPDMMSTFKRQSVNRQLTYAYTREIESDPADKMTYLTIEANNQSSFYYESPAPQNPTIITYDTFNPNDGLSYFYCKWPIFLVNNGPTDTIKYKLGIELSYSRNGQPVLITEGMNTAGGSRNASNAVLKFSDITQSDLIKEMVFISKHHGDVAQSLVKFRNVRMENPKSKGSYIDTNKYEGAFVSIDVNAIIKALTIQMPYIFMYPPTKDKIIVWKNTTNITDTDRYNYQVQYTQEKIDQYISKYKAYSNNIDKINANREMFNKKIEDRFNCLGGGAAAVADADADANALKRYKKLIEDGFSFAILSKYVPPKKLEHIEKSIPDVFIVARYSIEDLHKLRNDEINVAINELKALQANFEKESSIIQIPEKYGNSDIFSDKAKLLVEKEVGLLFNKNNDKYKLTNSKVVKNIWEYIDFRFIVGQGRGDKPDSITCRLGTRLNSSWGIDLIQYIHTELKKYNKDKANNFIICLKNIVKTLSADEIQTFNFGLQFIHFDDNKEMIGGMPVHGLRPPRWSKAASTYHPYSKSATHTVSRAASARNTRKLRPQLRKQAFKAPTDYATFVFQELDYITHHLHEMYKLACIYNNPAYINDKLGDKLGDELCDELCDELFKTAVLIELNFYSNKIFGDNFIDTTNDDMGIAAKQDVGIAAKQDVGIEAILEHKDDIKGESYYYYASYSVIQYYKRIGELYNNKIILSLITKLDIDPWEEESAGNAHMLNGAHGVAESKSSMEDGGGRRKYQKKRKTQKKRKSKVSKTIKRIRK